MLHKEWYISNLYFRQFWWLWLKKNKQTNKNKKNSWKIKTWNGSGHAVAFTIMGFTDYKSCQAESYHWRLKRVTIEFCTQEYYCTVEWKENVIFFVFFLKGAKTTRMTRGFRLWTKRHSRHLGKACNAMQFASMFQETF